MVRCGQQATQFANWALLEFAKLDSKPLVATEKGERLPPIGHAEKNNWLREVYQIGRARWPELDSQSLACKLRSLVEQKATAAGVNFEYTGNCEAAAEPQVLEES